MATPVRSTLLPYGRQSLDEDDVRAVVDVLRSDWLTTGPMVSRFETAFAEAVGAAEAVAVSNGTAALHAAVHALGIGPGDEVLVPCLSFVASANCVLYQGGTPVFVDVDPDTLLMDPADAKRKQTSRTRAAIVVDYAGQPCDSSHLDVPVIADACHALGAFDGPRPVGSLATMSTFSLHPVKPITTGEGGVITTNDAGLARRMRVFRNHGITTDHRERQSRGTFANDMVDLGMNYRLTDFQCALGLSQLQKLSAMTARRQQIAERYDTALAHLPHVRPLRVRPGVRHAWHLYVVRVPQRDAVFTALRQAGIGVNVHYMPIHLHSYYRQRLGTAEGLCPQAERVWQEILSLPIFPGMTDGDVEDVLTALHQVLA